MYEKNITTFFWLGPELQYYLTPNNMFFPTLIVFKSEVLQLLLASLVAQTVKNPPAMQETWVRYLDWEDPLEDSMATHSSVLAWRIPMDRGAWRATVHGVTKNRT